MNGQAIAPWRSFRCAPGDIIALGGCKIGARAYLAVSGGIAVPPALGSRSTDLLSQLGGYEGRALRAGDRVPLNPPDVLPPLRAVPRDRIPRYATAIPLRVILGPQDERITADALATFLSAPYTISNESNRMGARLLGPALTFRADSPGADILSEGIATGAVQVPAQGQPIILLAGHQTTGGYAKVATVIGADLWRLGQAAPGSSVSFQTVTIAEAREAWREFRGGIDPGALVPLTMDAAPMTETDDERDERRCAAGLHGRSRRHHRADRLDPGSGRSPPRTGGSNRRDRVHARDTDGTPPRTTDRRWYPEGDGDRAHNRGNRAGDGTARAGGRGTARRRGDHRAGAGDLLSRGQTGRTAVGRARRLRHSRTGRRPDRSDEDVLRGDRRSRRIYHRRARGKRRFGPVRPDPLQLSAPSRQTDRSRDTGRADDRAATRIVARDEASRDDDSDHPRSTRLHGHAGRLAEGAARANAHLSPPARLGGFRRGRAVATRPSSASATTI